MVGGVAHDEMLERDVLREGGREEATMRSSTWNRAVSLAERLAASVYSRASLATSGSRGFWKWPSAFLAAA